MWATLNPRLRSIAKLRSLAVGFLLVILSSFLITTVVHAANVTGQWFNNNGVISVKVGDREYFNPTQVGNEWLMLENRGGGQCNGQLKFSKDPTKDAEAAKTAEETIFKRLSNGEGGFDCSLEDQKNTVTISGSPATPTPGGGDGGDVSANDQVCTVGALGWVICPLINFMGTASDQASSLLQGILFVQPLSLDTASPTNSLYKAWSGILGVANILLAIAFLYVIFAQATSVGLSSYGVKKMLPRIIAAAILMNLSYFICAIAVDLSNLMGVGITGMLIGATSGSFSGDIFKPDTFTASGFGNSGIAEKIAGIGVGAIVIIWFLPPVLLGILAVLFTLAARLAIIVLLVMVAPIAFAAWILPNTEKYFKRWYELFFSMLVLFPMVMAVFAGASIASKMVIDTANIQPTAGTGITEDASRDVFLPLIGLLIQALPLFALPFLFKTAGGVLGKINAMARDTGHNRLGGKQLEGAWGRGRKNAGQRAVRYGKFGAIATGKGIAKGLGGGRPSTRLSRAFGSVGRAYLAVRGFDKAVEVADEARKRGRQERISEKAAEIGNQTHDVHTGEGSMTGAIVGGAIRNFGGSRYAEILSGQIDEAFSKRVSAIKSQLTLERPSAGRAGEQLSQALRDGNREQASALIQHMSKALGASGRAELERRLETTPIDMQNTGMVTAVSNAIQKEAYGDLIGKRGAIAKGGFDNTGRWMPNMSTVATASLASQDDDALERHFDRVTADGTPMFSQAEAQAIVSNASLWSTTANARARELIQRKALGLGMNAPLPPNPPTPENPINPPGGGGGGNTGGGGANPRGGGGTNPRGGGNTPPPTTFTGGGGGASSIPADPTGYQGNTPIRHDDDNAWPH